MHKATLSNISRELVANVEPQHDKTINLALREDDHQAWIILLHWAFARRLPEDAEDCPLLLVHSWALVEKYNVVDFQDEAMFALLSWCNNESADVETIEKAFESTAPGSKLRHLMAEELLYRVESGEGDDHELSNEGIDNFLKTSKLDHVTFATDILKARKRCALDEYYFQRFKKKKGNRSGKWKTFMVGDALMVHGRAAECEAESVA